MIVFSGALIPSLPAQAGEATEGSYLAGRNPPFALTFHHLAGNSRPA